ncbi:MAG: L-histidine N(alpha)-methyltransferase [Gemmatimonadales bacterium]|nr:L-histidine N(alpha)-methyltransferase [Gemmatimonadales bacterium]
MPRISGPVPSAAPSMLDEIRAGLSRSPKEIPPKYFYDHRGSELFERITELIEYYPTRTEREILEAWIPDRIPGLDVRALVELGAGSGEKTRVILDAMLAAHSPIVYVPIDVSAEFLKASAARLRVEYPGLKVLPIVADLADPLVLPRELPGPHLFAFLGSTIGNFRPKKAAALLGRIRAAMSSEDFFLLGVDLRKDVAVLEAAYNDAEGVTAEFNRNVLRVLNRTLGADFDLDAFRHRAVYHTGAHRIEMYLDSTREQNVTIPGIGVVRFRRDEPLRTEISCKYDRESVAALCSAAGLHLAEWKTDAKEWFALALAESRP